VFLTINLTQCKDPKFELTPEGTFSFRYGSERASTEHNQHSARHRPAPGQDSHLMRRLVRRQRAGALQHVKWRLTLMLLAVSYAAPLPRTAARGPAPVLTVAKVGQTKRTTRSSST